ncbi:hypothetical protein [Pseudomonas sp. S2_H01]
MSKMRKGRVLVALAIACSATSVFADGHLLAVGGMLRASNLPVYRKKTVTRDEWVEAVNAMVAKGLVTTVPADAHTADATVRRDEVAEFIAGAYGLADNS